MDSIPNSAELAIAKIEPASASPHALRLIAWIPPTRDIIPKVSDTAPITIRTVDEIPIISVIIAGISIVP
ncbi:MAG: hypothetical protein JSW24_03415, partial [Dehalococcoidia bacterium]